MSGLACPDNYQRSTNFLTRRSFLRGAAATTVCCSPSIAKASNSLGIDYLEGLSESSSLADANKFVAPHAVHDAYLHVMYVNVAYSGAAMQKMWVLQRRFSGWDLAYRDPTAVSGSDGWSWPVSSGALYANEARAGPTPVGVFNIDERTHRYRGGWGSPGMYKALYIDLHYSSGRASGVAIHGTTQSRYTHLGAPASHGCVRVTQSNMDVIHAMLFPNGEPREHSPLWGEVPRYFTSVPEDSWAPRSGYVRDASLLRDTNGNTLTKPGYKVLAVFFRDDRV